MPCYRFSNPSVSVDVDKNPKRCPTAGKSYYICVVRITGMRGGPRNVYNVEASKPAEAARLALQIFKQETNQ